MNQPINVPPSCPKCSVKGNIWHEVCTNVDQRVRGELFTVPVIAYECSKCGFSVFAQGQADNAVRRAVELYKQKHGLLTAEQIRQAREHLGMSQAAFADFLGVGIASIKRWEGLLIQDKSSDELIRAKIGNPSEEQLIRALVLGKKTGDAQSASVGKGAVVSLVEKLVGHGLSWNTFVGSRAYELAIRTATVKLELISASSRSVQVTRSVQFERTASFSIPDLWTSHGVTKIVTHYVLTPSVRDQIADEPQETDALSLAA